MQLQRKRDEMEQGACALSGLKTGQDRKKGLQLASECNLEEARWLCSIFPTGVPSRHDAKNVFLALGDEKKALFFAGRVCSYRLGGFSAFRGFGSECGCCRGANGVVQVL